MVGQLCISAYVREQRAYLMTLNHWMRWYDFSVVRKERAQAKLMLCFFFKLEQKGPASPTVVYMLALHEAVTNFTITA